MRRTPLLSALLSAAFVLTSCTALYYPGDDYLHGPADAAVPPGDGATTPDASSEAAIPVGPLVCPTNAIYCDDFERRTVGGNAWQVTGDVAIDSTHAHSPTRALLATTVSGGDAPNVQQPSVAVGARTKLDVWFYTPEAPQDGQGTKFRIAQMLWGDSCDWDLTWELLVNAASGVFLGIAVYDKSMNGSCGPVANGAAPTLLAPHEAFVDRWHHIVIIGDVSKQTHVVEVAVDDGAFASVTIQGTRSTVPTAANIGVGIPCIRTNGGCFTYTGPEYRVWIDDLVVAPAD